MLHDPPVPDKGTSARRRKAIAALRDAIRRCFDPKHRDYPRYGGRGVEVCLEWRANPAAFLRDVGLPPSPSPILQRIDETGHFEPCNCRWSSWVEPTGKGAAS